jgi:hypothetical protein
VSFYLFLFSLLLVVGVRAPICVFLLSSLCFFVNLSDCLSVCLIVCLFVCLFVCVFVCLFVCLLACAISLRLYAQGSEIVTVVVAKARGNCLWSLLACMLASKRTTVRSSESSAIHHGRIHSDARALSLSRSVLSCGMMWFDVISHAVCRCIMLCP